MKKLQHFLVCLVILAFACFVVINCQAADSPDLKTIEKIQPGVTTEADVRTLLGEPLSTKDILKAQGTAFVERRDMHYKVGSKEYIIRINLDTGRVAKVIEL